MTVAQSDSSDIRTTGPIGLLPAALRPYAVLSRLDRPIGWRLLLPPCWWALALAWPRPLDWTFLWYAFLFWLGAVAMRGAGCTYNDIVDRDIDARVARTATRPIPSGQVGVRQAAAWAGLQALVGLAVLLQFNGLTVGLGAASLLLVAIYPFMKRVTWWPQVFLRLAFNWGAIVGWTAATGGLDWPILPLYLAGILWTLGYDTIYAHQDIEDDILIGVRSTARRFGRHSRTWIGGFFVAMMALLWLTGRTAGADWPWFAGCGLAALMLAWQINTVRLHDPVSCLKAFRSTAGSAGRSRSGRSPPARYERRRRPAARVAPPRPGRRGRARR
ncbi:MAG: 4-hydroxybenzoate octaprenyltransferase [Alphaproteobacteria bacterium]